MAGLGFGANLNLSFRPGLSRQLASVQLVSRTSKFPEVRAPLFSFLSLPATELAGGHRLVTFSMGPILLLALHALGSPLAGRRPMRMCGGAVMEALPQWSGWPSRIFRPAEFARRTVRGPPLVCAALLTPHLTPPFFCSLLSFITP